MPEIQSFTFSLREIAEILIKEQNLHEGLWGIYVEFGFGAANVPAIAEGNLVPAAIAAVQKIGVQRFEESSSLTVDAAKVNPQPKRSKRETRTADTDA